MPQLHKIYTAGLALLGPREHLVGFQIHESEPHGSVTHDSFQVSFAAAPAELFLRIERDYRVARFPHAVLRGITPVTDAGS